MMTVVWWFRRNLSYSWYCFLSRMSHEWQAFISRTHKLRKVFVSVKGIYYQVQYCFFNSLAFHLVLRIGFIWFCCYVCSGRGKGAIDHMVDSSPFAASFDWRYWLQYHAKLFGVLRGYIFTNMFCFCFSSSPFLLPFQTQTSFFTYHIIVKVPLLLCCRLFLLLWIVIYIVP